MARFLVRCTRLAECWISFWMPSLLITMQCSLREKTFCFTARGGLALARETAQNMGLVRVSHIAGLFKEWKEANGPVEKV